MDHATVLDIVISLLKILLVFGALMQIVPILVYAERKICAGIQDRIGPNRVGPFGILQPLADAVKFIFKEDIIPDQADRALYVLAPLLALVPAVTAFAVIPFGNAVTLTPRGVDALVRPLGLAGTVCGGALVLAGLIARLRRPSRSWLFALLCVLGVVVAAGALAAAYGLRVLSAAIPAGGHVVHLRIADLGVGVLFFISVASMGVYGIALGGWASNSKFSLLGSLRASAQMISYEITLGLSLILALMATSDTLTGVGTVQVSEIVSRQTGVSSFFGIPFPSGWNVFRQPLACVLFLIAAFAENNRLPFDLSECEPELVGGYHTEYSSMKFALFFMGEYLAMVTLSAMLVTLFLGGWHVPGLDPSDRSLFAGLASVVSFGAKVGAILFLYIWVRWSIPRFRYDQLMRLGWKVLVPAALLNLVVSAVLGVF